MNGLDDDGTADPGERVNGVRIVADPPDEEAIELMRRMVRALPDELCQIMATLRCEAEQRRFAVEMEDGLDRPELTGPIADGLVVVLEQLGVRHGGVSVGGSTRVGPS